VPPRVDEKMIRQTIAGRSLASVGYIPSVWAGLCIERRNEPSTCAKARPSSLARSETREIASPPNTRLLARVSLGLVKKNVLISPTSFYYMESRQFIYVKLVHNHKSPGSSPMIWKKLTDQGGVDHGI
jgi:hypothetical protein